MSSRWSHLAGQHEEYCAVGSGARAHVSRQRWWWDGAAAHDPGMGHAGSLPYIPHPVAVALPQTAPELLKLEEVPN